MDMEEKQNLNEAVETTEQAPVEQNARKAVVCAKCGTVLAEGQEYCPKCGTKAGEAPRKDKGKVNPLKVVLPILLALVLILCGTVGFLLIRGKQVSSVLLNKTEVTIEEGTTLKLVCTVSPDDAKDKTITWRSSNDDVATVSEEGVISAKKEGACTITAQSNNGKTDSCKVIVDKHIPNFKDLFGSKAKQNYFSISSDGKSMKIDTNPNDKDSDDFNWSDYTTLLEATDMIEEVNEKLGFSSVLTDKMNSTNALQGMLSQENANYTVSWSYHPDHGLQVFYEVKDK